VTDEEVPISIHLQALAPRSARTEGHHRPQVAQGGSRGSGAPTDTVTLSEPSTVGSDARARDADKSADAPPPVLGAGQAQGLTEDEQALVDQLRARDREVRAHEAAHQASGGTLTGGARFAYQTGPDGRSYAVGGEVAISLSAGRTPEETIQRARQIRAAALAPADPSGQDLQVASEAAAIELQAQLELAQLQQLERHPTRLPDHLHGGAPCLACEQNAASYRA
jgi:hypothetical protein